MGVSENWSSKLEDLREAVVAASLEQLLHRQVEPEILRQLDDRIQEHIQLGQRKLDHFLARDVADRLPIQGSGWQRLCDYFGPEVDPMMSEEPYSLLECLVRLRDPKEVGVWIGDNVLGSLEPALIFDKDGLLVGKNVRCELTKEGVLTDRHWIRYDPRMPGGSKSEAFLDDLLTAWTRLPEMSAFGLAIDGTVVHERVYHQNCITKAFIRGPKGLSVERLRDPMYPEDPTGTVTVHERVEAPPLSTLYSPLIRTEFMWSRRDGIKTIQIEELAAIDEKASKRGYVENRYVHGQWDPDLSAMVHFDGAVKGFPCDSYQERLDTDIKKYEKKAASYTKLFRMDARIPLEVWCWLTAKFFEHNEMVMEYFGGPAESDVRAGR